MRFLLLFVGVIIFLSGCVSNKKVVLLQKNDLNVNGLPKDTTVRKYRLGTFNYKIQPNDILSIRVTSLTDKSFDFFQGYSNANQAASQVLTAGDAQLMGELVDEQGKIPFPVLGNFKVSGLTIFEIQDTLQKTADQYFESPIVKVRLLNYRITILGEVKNEGSITLTNNRVTLLEAIALANGLGELADRSNIKLIRQNGNNETEVKYIDLLDENFMTSPYYYVNQNDVLIVPPLKQRPFRLYAGQNLALFISTVSVILLTLNLLRN